MARNRNKVYEQGDRINIYLSRDLSPEFVDWINSQSDLSNFFLYAAQQLYRQTGFIDTSEVMPRKINFDLKSLDTSNPAPIPRPQQPARKPAPEVPVAEARKEAAAGKEEDEFMEQPNDEKVQEEQNAWSSLEDLDDPFA